MWYEWLEFPLACCRVSVHGDGMTWSFSEFNATSRERIRPDTRKLCITLSLWTLPSHARLVAHVAHDQSIIEVPQGRNELGSIPYELHLSVQHEPKGQLVLAGNTSLWIFNVGIPTGRLTVDRISCSIYQKAPSVTSQQRFPHLQVRCERTHEAPLLRDGDRILCPQLSSWDALGPLLKKLAESARLPELKTNRSRERQHLT